MEHFDLQTATDLAGATWLLISFLLTLFFALLAVLLPFFVWRIWKWSHATCEQVRFLNDKMDRLLQTLERSERPDTGGGFVFSDAENLPARDEPAETPQEQAAAPAPAPPIVEEPPAATEPEAVPPATTPPAAQAERLEPDPAKPQVALARCRDCGHKLAYRMELAGKKVRCPSCRSALYLP